MKARLIGKFGFHCCCLDFCDLGDFVELSELGVNLGVNFGVYFGVEFIFLLFGFGVEENIFLLPYILLLVRLPNFKPAKCC